MKANVLNKKVVAIGLLAVASIAATVLVFANNSLNKKLADEKLKSEILLSEKLSMDKLISNNQADLKNLEEKNKKLDKISADAKMEVLSKNKEIEKLKANQKSTKKLQGQIDELEIQKQRQLKEIGELNKSLAEVKSANSKLSAQLGLASVANRGLSSDNSILKAMISDNYRTEALKGKRDKLTVVAKKTSKLMMSFDMPEIYSEKIYFKVVTPDGKEYSLDGDMIANVKTVSNGDGLMASIIPNAAGPVGTQRVEMTYQPLKKLSEGVYLFSIYNEDRLLGSTQLRLK